MPRRNSDDPTTLTRSELFELVWKEPMRSLAPRFGVSDVGLAKMCRRFDVPTPPRGYWAKLQHGKRVKRPPLPAASPNMAERILITVEARVPTDDDGLPGDIVGLIETIGQRTVVVPRSPSRLHSVIERWRDEDKAKKQSLYFNSPRLTATERRRRQILSALFREIEKLKGSVKADNRYKFIVSLAGEALEVSCAERNKQVKVPLTAEERRTWYSSKDHRTESQPTGEIRLRIEGYFKERLRRDWHDLRDKPLEDQLQEVLTGFARAAAFVRRDRLVREEEARRRREAEERRWISEQKREKVDKFLKEAITNSRSWIRAAHLRDYANATVCLLGDPSDEEAVSARALAQWTLSAADAIDPLVDGPDVAQLFELLPKYEDEEDDFSF